MNAHACPKVDKPCMKSKNWREDVSVIFFLSFVGCDEVSRGGSYWEVRLVSFVSAKNTCMVTTAEGTQSAKCAERETASFCSVQLYRIKHPEVAGWNTYTHSKEENTHTYTPFNLNPSRAHKVC